MCTNLSKHRTYNMKQKTINSSIEKQCPIQRNQTLNTISTHNQHSKTNQHNHIMGCKLSSTSIIHNKTHRMFQSYIYDSIQKYSKCNCFRAFEYYTHTQSSL